MSWERKLGFAKQLSGRIRVDHIQLCQMKIFTGRGGSVGMNEAAVDVMAVSDRSSPSDGLKVKLRRSL